MIEDVQRNMLDEDDPDYLDLHSQTAIKAFQLTGPRGETLAPTKASLELLDKLPLRTGAKTVNFSIPYGSGNEAIARKCREEGADITIDDAARLKDGYFELYPENFNFLLECEQRAADPGWICGTFGRYRRFAPTTDEAILADMQRQAKNFPIQNAVADAISTAMWKLWEYRRKHAATGGKEWFWFCLQIHDALLFECKPEHVEFTIHALKTCMVDQVPIYPRYLDGTPMLGLGPYHFGVDVELYQWWGDKIKEDEARALKLPDHAAIKALLNTRV
jgi:DNA polymerase I-like protein with 3'-5' exonuclease and polymerase domains